MSEQPAPRADRRRLVALVAIAAVAAFAVVVLALASLGREPAPAQAPQRSSPIAGRPPLVFDLPARYAARGSGGDQGRAERLRRLGDPAADPVLALALVEAEHGAGRVAAARAALAQAGAQLGEDDLRVVVGRELLDWSPGRAPAIADALGALADQNPGSALPAFEQGLALLFAGHAREAETALREARSAVPDGPYALRADNLIHPGMVKGYPPWFAGRALASAPVAELERRARARPADVAAQLSLAAALQSAGRRGDAADAAASAVAADPNDVDARVATAVLGFDKDRPELAFGAIGTMIRAQRAEPSPHLHLGLLLSWLRERDKAREQYRLAASLDPDGRIGRLADALAARG